MLTGVAFAKKPSFFVVSSKLLGMEVFFEKNEKMFAKSETFCNFAASNRKEVEIKVRYLQDAHDFLKEVEADAKKKILYNVKKVRMGVKDKNLFKKLDNTNIWEFRTLHGGNCYRLLSFWDTLTETLIVATHGFVKKSGKTPKKEIDKAEAIRKDYFDNN